MARERGAFNCQALCFAAQKSNRSCSKRRTDQKKESLINAIRPIVELYPVMRMRSGQDTKWEILPTKERDYPRNYKLRKVLEESHGIYFFYNSQGEVLYTGKAERQSLWREINLSFNHKRKSHAAFRVAHPTTGTSFDPAWKKSRQPKKTVIHFHDVASFFSAYDVADEMIGHLEALVIRATCNDLSNVQMAKFTFQVDS